MNHLYGVPLSPYCRKVQLAFAYREIPYELVATTPGADGAEFLAASPLRKIPAIKTEQGHQFADSSVIIAYFEKASSDKPLYPADLGDYATALFLEELADTKLSEATSALYFQLILGPGIYGKPADEKRVEQLKQELIPAQLALLETLLPESGWLVGNSYSVADVSVGAHLINLWHADFNIDANLYPRVATFFDAFMQREEVKQHLQAERQALQHFGNAAK